ncbi:MAG: heme-binding beta-barrel domain-containing protein [Bacteroidota bacterium]
MKKLILMALLFPSFLFAQNTKQDSIWIPLKSFIGTWKGEGVGEPGNGKYERSYQFILNKKFIEVKNKSIYPPSKDHPNGEVHEDVGYISYDKARKTFVLRQFHIEGFVNQYKLESISQDGNTLVFVSEAIENIPDGYRARETYQFGSEKEFTEVFELAEPGKGFELYSKVTLSR